MQLWREGDKGGGGRSQGARQQDDRSQCSGHQGVAKVRNNSQGQRCTVSSTLLARPIRCCQYTAIVELYCCCCLPGPPLTFCVPLWLRCCPAADGCLVATQLTRWAGVLLLLADCGIDRPAIVPTAPSLLLRLVQLQWRQGVCVLLLLLLPWACCRGRVVQPLLLEARVGQGSSRSQ